MSATQFPDFPVLFTCVQCRRRGRAGTIMADLGQIAALPPRPEMQDVDLADPGGPRPLVFGPDSSISGPCGDTIDVSVHGSVHLPGRRGPRRASFYARWVHPWL